MDSRTENELHGTNASFLAMLIEMARNDREPTFEVVRTFAPRLLELDDEAREWAAKRPYLLLDFCWWEGLWWQSSLTGQSDNFKTTWTSCFPRTAAVELARRALTLVWHAAGTRPTESSVRLGVSPSVTMILSGMRLEDLERIADARVDRMRPRWANRLGMWRRLLDAAKSGEMQALNFVDRLSAQMLATDMMKKDCGA